MRPVTIRATRRAMC